MKLTCAYTVEMSQQFTTGHSVDDFIHGFWIDRNNNLATIETGCKFIPPSQLTYIYKTDER